MARVQGWGLPSLGGSQDPRHPFLFSSAGVGGSRPGGSALKDQRTADRALHGSHSLGPQDRSLVVSEHC